MPDDVLSLVHLYPRMMSTYGDRGNILSLRRRTEGRGIGFELHRVEAGGELPESPDLVFWGGGQDTQQQVCSRDLFETGKHETLLRWAREGVVMLLVCGGYQLMGEVFVTAEGEEIEGVGFLPVRTEGGEERLTGNVAARITDSVPPLEGELLLGFENHSGRTLLLEGAEPIAETVRGAGNNGEDRTCGCVRNSVFGCYLHGPLLPRNPGFADFLIARALHAPGSEATLTEFEEHYAEPARSAHLRRMGMQG